MVDKLVELNVGHMVKQIRERPGILWRTNDDVGLLAVSLI